MPVTRDHNNALRKAYFAALTGITYGGNPIPVYADEAPDEPGSTYITFAPLTNSDDSPKNAVVLDATILVSVYTSAPKYHNATVVDAISDEVLQRITAGLTINGVQNVFTTMVNDNTERPRILNQLVAIDRLITFRHKIFQGT